MFNASEPEFRHFGTLCFETLCFGRQGGPEDDPELELGD